MKDQTAFIFCIGRELLEGLTLDRNANFIAGRLSGLGFRVRTIQVLDDVEEEMVAAFQQALAAKPALLFTTGGMGPGNDDITRQAIAKAAGLPLVSDAKAAEMLKNSYRRLHARGIVEDAELNDERKRMAQVPKGATCYENPMGTAPAISLEVGPTLLFLLPGVSEEMQRMINDHALPTLQKLAGGRRRKTRVVEYPHRDESALGKLLQETSKRFPGVATQAHTSTDMQIKIVLSAEDADERTLDRRLQDAEADLRARFGLETRE